MRSDLQLARQTLESKLRAITNPFGWRDAIVVRPSADPADTTQHMIEREMASRRLNQNTSLVRELRAALDRVEEGSYGLCIDCDDPIAARRLAAAPWAARCLRCQERLEAGAERLAA